MLKNNALELRGGELIKYRGTGGRVTIPDGVTALHEYAFSGCETVTEVILPDSVTVIGDCAFKNCKNLKAITIPRSVTRIGWRAFRNCASLKEICLPDSIERIGSYAFMECASLTVAVISGGTKLISELFSECPSLREAVISEGVTSIGGDTFCQCPNLRTVMIPETVTRIWDNAFNECPNISHVICREKLDEKLPPILRAKTLSRFARKLTLNEASDEEKETWLECLRKYPTEALAAVKNEPTLYSLITENRLLTEAQAESVLDFTESIECRAILLEYKKTL